METKLEVSRGPNGLRLHLPSGRTLDISATEAGVRMIERILKESDERAHYDRVASGYIGDFPTQHVIDIWERQERTKGELAAQRREMDRKAAEIKERKRQEAARKLEERWSAEGISIADLDIEI